MGKKQNPATLPATSQVLVHLSSLLPSPLLPWGRVFTSLRGCSLALGREDSKDDLEPELMALHGILGIITFQDSLHWNGDLLSVSRRDYEEASFNSSVLSKTRVEILTGALWTLIKVYFEKEYSFFRSVILKVSVSSPSVL